MRISSKLRYALAAMVELAATPRGVVSVAELSKRRSIPRPFLEQLLLRLKRAGLAESRRGPDGGYRLARPAEEIRLLEIYEAIEGPLDFSAEKRSDETDLVALAVEGLWFDLEEAIRDFLRQHTLEDLRLRVEEHGHAIPVAHTYTFSI